jgi:hypothetical protein
MGEERRRIHRWEPGRTLVIGGIVMGAVGMGLMSFAWTPLVHGVGDALFLLGFLALSVGVVKSYWQTYQGRRPTGRALKDFVRSNFLRLLLGLLIIAASFIISRRMGKHTRKGPNSERGVPQNEEKVVGPEAPNPE